MSLRCNKGRSALIFFAIEKSIAHALSLDKRDFQNFIEISKPYDFDIMLEIKDKEKSAIDALGVVKNDFRFY